MTTTTEAALRDAAEQARNFTNRIAHGCWGNGYITEAKEITHRLAVALSQPSPASSTAGEGDAWEQVGFWKEKAEQAERDRDVWKERAMALRLSPSSGEPASVAVEADK